MYQVYQHFIIFMILYKCTCAISCLKDQKQYKAAHFEIDDYLYIPFYNNQQDNQKLYESYQPEFIISFCL